MDKLTKSNVQEITKGYYPKKLTQESLEEESYGYYVIKIEDNEIFFMDSIRANKGLEFIVVPKLKVYQNIYTKHKDQYIRNLSNKNDVVLFVYNYLKALVREHLKKEELRGNSTGKTVKLQGVPFNKEFVKYLQEFVPDVNANKSQEVIIKGYLNTSRNWDNFQAEITEVKYKGTIDGEHYKRNMNIKPSGEFIYQLIYPSVSFHPDPSKYSFMVRNFKIDVKKFQIEG